MATPAKRVGKMIELPSPDSNTIWTAIFTIITAPIVWIWRKLRFLEVNSVSKEDFESRLDELEKSNTERTQVIRTDIADLKTSINLLISHSLKK